MKVEHSLDGWQVTAADGADWVPWGGSGADARAKVLAIADGYYLTLVEAQPGYRGDPHEHANPEFLSVIEGALVTQGAEIGAGGAYAASTGSVHTDFETPGGATYLLVFKL